MPELILLIGIPGAGKSFYTKKYDYDRYIKTVRGVGYILSD